MKLLSALGWLSVFALSWLIVCGVLPCDVMSLGFGSFFLSVSIGAYAMGLPSINKHAGING